MLWLLCGAIAAGLLSTVVPHTWLHWVLGALYLAGIVAALVKLPNAQGRYWLVFMSLLISLGANAFGVLFLLARRHPRRVHRHIIYTGYGLVFAIIALCWVLAVRYPHHDLAATIASVAAYAIGSLVILAYKSYQTGRRARRP